MVSLNGGFSGNALILRPHLDRKDFTPRHRAARRREQSALRPTVEALFCRCRELVQTCLGMRELEHMTPAQLQAEWAHAKATVANLTALRGPLLEARREAPEMGRFLQATNVWLKLIAYQLRDLERFSRTHLGTPTAQEIARLEVVR